MLKFKSIRTELIVSLCLSLTLVLALVAYYYIDSVADKAKQQAEQGLAHTVSLKALEIESFFKLRGDVVETMLASPSLIKWFDEYHERQKDLSDDTVYPQIIQWFKNMEQRDSSTKAVFFASAATGEYFDNANERYQGDGTYYATKRPWWGEAIKVNRLFVTQPEVDYVDHTIVSSVKRTVYNKDGKLIGVAGIDILLSTIEEKIGKQLRYEGQGQGFLINRNGKTIMFPASAEELPADSELKLVDEKVGGSDGFSELAAQINQQSQGFTQVKWNGKTNLVSYVSISVDSPYMDWVVGIMVPESLVDQTVYASIREALLVMVLVLSLVLVVVAFVSTRLLSPLKNLVLAITGIAHGEGDLTKRIKVDSQNEIGEFANQFNFFVGRFQQIIALNKQTVHELFLSADKATSITNLSAEHAKQQRDATDMVATAAEELSYSVNQVSENSSIASAQANQAENEVKRGVVVVNEASHSIRTLAQTVEKSSQVVSKLNRDSKKITEVLEVIRSIAEQTNLLALNAAIEAARAGDQGRGFAVVADEVRSLASRTQESTQSINNIIDELQSSAAEAARSMELGTNQAALGVEKSALVQAVLDTIALAISEIQKQSQEIDRSTGEQAKASAAITERAAAIRQLAESTSQEIGEVQKGSSEQQSGLQKLSELIGQFKT